MKNKSDTTDLSDNYLVVWNEEQITAFVQGLQGRHSNITGIYLYLKSYISK